MIYGDEVFKIIFSGLLGCLVGLEREIRRKPAGFRTLALIAVGATIFTICSYKLGVVDNRDRIAANIITGVGFLGAGVIFHNKDSVANITTAATIWIAAALGMLIGVGEYMLAVLSLFTSLVILYVFQFLQNWIDSQFQHRDYTVSFKDEFNADEFRAKLTEWKLRSHNFKETRLGEQTTFEFDVTGKQIHMDVFNQWLKGEGRVYSFDW